MNWVVGTADVEVIDATTGRRSCGRSSRLCKHRLSARWARLYGKVRAAPSQGLRAGGGGGQRWGQVTANTPTDPPGTLDVAPPSRSPTRSRLSLWPQKQMERGSVVNGGITYSPNVVAFVDCPGMWQSTALLCFLTLGLPR